MYKVFVFILASIFLAKLAFLVPPVYAACSPPQDYSSCGISSFGDHLAGNLLDSNSQATTARTNFAILREQAETDNSENTNRQIQATVIISPDLVRNPAAMADVLAASKEYGINLTMTLEITRDEAKDIGNSLKTELTSAGMLNTVNIEILNEANYRDSGDLTGREYGATLNEFVNGCAGCPIFLTALGGPPGSDQNKIDFVSDFAKNYPSFFDKVSGIAFNTYGGSPHEAITDWLKSYDFWQNAAKSAGASIDNKTVFLTEVGPPGGDPNWPDINNFIVSLAQEFETLKQSDPRFKNVEGLTYFLWQGDGTKMVITYADGKTKVTLVKKQLINQGTNLEKRIVFRSLRQRSSPLRSFAEESEEPCPNVEGDFSSGDIPGDNPTYHKTSGGSEPAFNGSLGMNFSTSVKGAHCGQTKSQPLVLEEVAPFDLSKDPQCKTVRWAGEIQLNYNSPDNFRLPFAKELADHWAGKGPEHDVTAGGFLQTIQQLAQKVVPGLAAPPPVPAGGKYPLIGVSNVDKNAENNTDNNMWLRPAPVLVNQPKALIQCGYPADQPPDPQAPQLSSIVGTDPGKPDAFGNTYRVLDPGGGLAGNWDVGLLGLNSTPGQVVKAPGGGHDIDGSGDKYMVTYAEEHKITLINATQDTVVIDGQLPYVVHIDGIDVDPALVQAYREANAAGRNYLPALSGSEPIGVASGDEVRVAVRDSGDWMDPRSKGDWWQDHPDAPVGGLCKGGAGGPSAKKTSQDRKLLTDAGVLKKLLPSDNQDALKCSFINYVKKKGPTSGYANFGFDGTRLTDIPCPPTVSGNYDQKANDDWRNSWGKMWAKMGLFPDEKSTGQLRFAVCADKLYDMENAYPNVFRLGQAANELFKVFTAKDNQDNYYRANKDENNLKRPLDQNRSLVKTQNAIMQALAGVFQNLLDKVKQTFSNLSSEIDRRMAFAQETVSPTVTSTIFVKDGKIQFYATVTNPPFVEDDMAAELTINGEKKETSGYHNIRNPAVGVGGSATFGSKGSGATFEVWDPLPLTPGQTYDISYHISTNYQCLNNKLCGPDSNFTGSAENAGYCGVTVTSSGTLDTKCGGQPPPPQPVAPICPPNTCCETPTCSASCGICGRAEKDPSDTTIWPAQYPKNHSLIGVTWDDPAGPAGRRFDDNTKVKLTFKIPGWENGNPLPEGCKFVQCSLTDLSCLASLKDTTPGCDDTGKCGLIRCAKVHTRVVDVYNKVPFLASVWNQAAGVGSGFFNIFRSASLNGSGLNNNITGCTANTDLVLNPSGNFGSNPAYSELTYGFDQGFGVGGERASFNFGQNEVTVTQVSPGQGGKAKITFYRLGGVCNADTWVSQKLLAP